MMASNALPQAWLWPLPVGIRMNRIGGSGRGWNNREKRRALEVWHQAMKE